MFVWKIFTAKRGRKVTSGNRELRDTEKAEELPQIPRRPLPQILAEMEANIRAALEAARRAEEAAKSAKQAAVVATKA